MIPAQREMTGKISELSPLLEEGAFSRLDESDDTVFYRTDRFVSHLDDLARETVRDIIDQLITEEEPVILDLMAGWDSHLPDSLKARKVIGLGLNRNELLRNESLTEILIHDINRNPHIPLPDASADVVLNTVSVDYMTRPIEVFLEVGRILRPGGLFLVIFSNRMFQQKAVRVWRESDEEERVLLVEELFLLTGEFEKPRIFASKEKPRPTGDQYTRFGIPSDPIYAVYADRRGGSRGGQRPLPLVTGATPDMPDKSTVEERKKTIGKTLTCPYCQGRLKKWGVPDNPFAQTWTNEFMYICFNDGCPYYLGGWDHMYREGNRSASYRFMYDPEKECCLPVPVPSRRALRDGIIEEG